MTYWPESLEDSWAASVSGRNATASNKPMTSGILNMGISYQFGGLRERIFRDFENANTLSLAAAIPAEPLFQYELYAHDGGGLFRIAHFR
jgi:hypothetical protein